MALRISAVVNSAETGLAAGVGRAKAKRSKQAPAKVRDLSDADMALSCPAKPRDFNDKYKCALTGSAPSANLRAMFSDAIRRMPRPQDVVLMNTEQLRETFLVPGLFAPGELRGVFTD